jgi:hypothetical protein
MARFVKPPATKIARTGFVASLSLTGGSSVFKGGARYFPASRYGLVATDSIANSTAATLGQKLFDRE